MMRLQFEMLSTKLFELVDDVMDMETLEGQEVLKTLRQSLHALHPDTKSDRCPNTPDMFTNQSGPWMGPTELGVSDE